MKLLLIPAGKKIIKIIERQTLVDKMFTNSNTSVAEKCQLSMCYGIFAKQVSNPRQTFIRKGI